MKLRSALAALALSTPIGALAEASISLTHQGLLLAADDQPINVPVTLRFRVMNTRSPGEPNEQAIWTSNECQVGVRNGRYGVVLGTECAGPQPLTAEALAPTSPRFLEVSAGGVPLLPRLTLSAVPNAFLAARALDAAKLEGAARADFWERSADLAGAKFGAATIADRFTSLDTTLTARITAVEGKIPGVGQTGELPAAVIPALDAAKIGSGTLSLARGGTGADLSMTGGPGRFLRQSTTGGAVTVAPITAADLPVFGGASAGAAGLAGLAPAPAAGDQGRFLRGDGAWVEVPSPWVVNGSDVLRGAGNVGIGVSVPKAKLDVAGTVKLGSGTTCNGETEGSLRYNTTSKSVQVCNGATWAAVTGQAPRTCREVLEQGIGTTDGSYQLDPDGPLTTWAPFTAYCDMGTLNGGWTLALNLDTSDGRIQWYNVTNFWTSDTYNVGTDNAPFGGDYKRAAIFAGLKATQVLVRVHKNGATVGWRAWNLNVGDRSLQSYFSGGSNVRLTAGSVASDLTALSSREAVVVPGGELDLNRSVAANDLNRVWNTASNANDNVNGGLGTYHDSTSGECSRPCSDALAVASSGNWGAGLIGTDTDGRTLYGSYSSLDYDYAIYVR